MLAAFLVFLALLAGLAVLDARFFLLCLFFLVLLALLAVTDIRYTIVSLCLLCFLCNRRGPLLAWASEGGLKIMDVDKGKAGERISYVDK